MSQVSGRSKKHEGIRLRITGSLIFRLDRKFWCRHQLPVNPGLKTIYCPDQFQNILRRDAWRDVSGKSTPVSAKNGGSLESVQLAKSPVPDAVHRQRSVKRLTERVMSLSLLPVPNAPEHS